MSILSMPPSTGEPDSRPTPTRASPPSRRRPTLPRGWSAAQRWARANTFAPAWMPRQFQHPLVGYSAAILLQCLATGLGLLLIYAFANFALPAVPMILVIVFIGIFWGAAPSLLAVIVGVLLFSIAIIPPRFTLVIPHLSDVWEFGLLILVGFLIALAASQREYLRRRTEGLLALLGQAHTRAERERLRLRQVLEVLPAGVAITDRQTLILEMNATMRALWELETPPVGQSIRTLAKSWRPTADRSTPAQQGALAHALETGETAPGGQVEIETQSGQRKTILHSAAPIRDESGAIVGGVVADMDITEQKQLEEALREANRQMDAFLGMASHELKTPLTVLQLQIQAARRRLQRLASAEAEAAGRARTLEPAQEPLARMEQQVRRLERLVSDLLDVSRIRAGKLEMRLEPVDLAALVLRIVEEQRQAAPARTITLSLPTCQLAPLVADGDRIGQVLTNYLTNALRYSPAEQPVEAGLEVEGQQARVWVRDAGPGIPAADQERIWDRFYRVQGVKAQSGTGVGLGLGLSICREIIERHHGQVGVQSAPGFGSTFWFTLPLVR